MKTHLPKTTLPLLNKYLDKLFVERFLTTMNSSKSIMNGIEINEKLRYNRKFADFSIVSTNFSRGIAY